MRTEISALQRSGLRVSAEETTAVHRPGGQQEIQLSLVAPDRPGILREITRVLADNQANIESLETAFEAAPWTGEPLFKASMAVRTNDETSAEVLKGALEAIAHGLMLDLNVTLPR